MTTMENTQIIDGRQLVLTADIPTAYPRVMVSPRTALNWLATQNKNRKHSQQVSRRYATDMRTGLWTYTPASISFDVDGHLIDGQHRMEAVATLPRNTQIMFMVVTGMPPESQSAMDQGSKRTTGQQLSLNDIKNPSFVAAATRLLIMHDQDLLFSSSHLTMQITSPTILKWVQDNEELVAFTHQHYAKITSTDAPPSAAGAFALLVARRDPEAAELFFTTLYEMVNLLPGSPMIALVRRFKRLKSEGNAHPQRDSLALFIQAYNAWMNNERVQKFQKPKGGEWTPETFPELV